MDSNGDGVPPRLETRRLILQPLGAASMQARCAREPLPVARTCGFADGDDWQAAESMLRRRRRLRIASLARAPAFAAWVPRAIVRRADGVAIGHINFHTTPDPEYLRPWPPGGIELGFVAIGVWQDAEDGPEVVYARDAEPVSKKRCKALIGK